MKINEVETMLGITKANIRFYEKQGLLSPQRKENGYRDYSDAEIQRLKSIIILRKLNIPIPQIKEILDGSLPLQEAIAHSIASLQMEIEQLSGSLSLCQTLQKENAVSLDTQRYWQLIQERERQGFHFQNIARDYLAFIAPVYEDLYWLPRRTVFCRPALSLRYLTYILFYILLAAGIGTAVTGNGYFSEFFSHIKTILLRVLFLAAILLPIFLYSRKNRKKAESIRNMVPTFLIACVPLAFFLMVMLIWIMDLT